MDSCMDSSKGEEEVATEDHSILCRPIQTGASAVKMIVNSLKNGTPEIRDLLLNESDIIFECKVCRSLHRSFVNFIAHKRTYCLKHLCESMQLFNENFAEEETIVVEPEEVPEEAELTPEASIDEVNGKETEEEKFEPVEDRLAVEIKVENASERAQIPRKLFSFQDRKLTRRWHRVNTNNGESGESSGTSATSKFYQSCVNHVRTRRSRRVETRLELRAIASNPNAVFQTLANPPESSRTSPVISAVKEHAQAAAVKCLVQGGDKKRNCVKCGKRFKSLRKMMIHVQTVHAKTRTFYPCLLCKTQFSNIWGCIRHLMNFHKKTKMQVEKLKDKIKAKAVEKTVEENKQESNQQNPVVQEPVVAALTPPLPVMCQPVVQLENTPVFQCNICSKVFSQKPSLDGHRSSCLTKQRLAAAAALSAAKQSEAVVPVPEAEVSPEEPARSTRPRRIVKKKMLDEGFVNSSHLNIRTNSVNVPKKAETSPPATPSSKQPEQRKFLQQLNAIIDSRRRQCLRCKQTFVTISNARRHAAAHIGYNRFRCRKCEFHAYGRAQIRCHILKAHVDDRNRTMKQDEVDRLIVSLENEPEGEWDEEEEQEEEQEEEGAPEVKQEQEENRKRGVLAAQTDPDSVGDHAGEDEEEGEGEQEPEGEGRAEVLHGAGEWRVMLSPPSVSGSGSDSFIRCVDISEAGSTSPVYIFEFADPHEEPEEPNEEPEELNEEPEEITGEAEADHEEPKNKNLKRKIEDEEPTVEHVDQMKAQINGKPQMNGKPEIEEVKSEVVDQYTKYLKTYAKKPKPANEEPEVGVLSQETEAVEPDVWMEKLRAVLYEDHNYFSLANGNCVAEVETVPEEAPLAVRRMRRGHVEQQELLKAVGSIIK